MISENQIKRVRANLEKGDAKDFIIGTAKTPVGVNDQFGKLPGGFIKLEKGTKMREIPDLEYRIEQLPTGPGAEINHCNYGSDAPDDSCGANEATSYKSQKKSDISPIWMEKWA